MQKKEGLTKKINLLKDHCDGLLAIGDKHFPQYRGNVKESERPIFLFYKGDINLLNITNNNITVIGLLNPDTSITTREQKIITEIIKRNVTIISGLALGCDTIAHQEALKGGKTVAILPSPLNNIMPSRNARLAHEIVEKGGLIITEYYDDFNSNMDLNNRYKERDRLQALFCDTIILIASYSKDLVSRWKMNKKLDSGARLAMEYARSYNIQRAIMYDRSIDENNPMFDLNRHLINEQNNIVILTQKKLEEIINQIENKKETQYQLFNYSEIKFQFFKSQLNMQEALYLTNMPINEIHLNNEYFKSQI